MRCAFLFTTATFDGVASLALRWVWQWLKKWCMPPNVPPPAPKSVCQARHAWVITPAPFLSGRAWLSASSMSYNFWWAGPCNWNFLVCRSSSSPQKTRCWVGFKIDFFTEMRNPHILSLHIRTQSSFSTLVTVGPTKRMSLIWAHAKTLMSASTTFRTPCKIAHWQLKMVCSCLPPEGWDSAHPLVRAHCKTCCKGLYKPSTSCPSQVFYSKASVQQLVRIGKAFDT